MYIIYSTSNNNLFKEIKNEIVVGFWVEMDKSEEKREKFYEEIHFPYPHRKSISTIIKKNVDKARKHLRGIVPHQTPKK